MNATQEVLSNVTNEVLSVSWLIDSDNPDFDHERTRVAVECEGGEYVIEALSPKDWRAAVKLTLLSSRLARQLNRPDLVCMVGRDCDITQAVNRLRQLAPYLGVHRIGSKRGVTRWRF